MNLGLFKSVTRIQSFILSNLSRQNSRSQDPSPGELDPKTNNLLQFHLKFGLERLSPGSEQSHNIIH